MIIPNLVAVLLFSAQATTPALKAFDTPEAAAEAVIAAAEKNDQAELSAIFGTRSKAILTSGDPAQDRQEREDFARMARSAHHIEKDPMNLHRVILDVGPEDWPFPVPLVESNGKWSFDPDQGDLEVRARRIGANELDTVEALHGLVEAQLEYATADHDADGILEYARSIANSPGKHDGLAGEKDAPPVLQLLADAELRSGKTRATPYSGYYFRVLDSQGPNAWGGKHLYLVEDKHMMAGFAIVAWPAEYGVTGIHTFVVNQDGEIFEKDCGKPVSNLQPPVRSYDPDKTWQFVDEP
jgi:hypothetical protein